MRKDAISFGFPIRRPLVSRLEPFFFAGRSGFWYPAPVRRTPFSLFAALFACALSARAAATPLWCGEGAAVFGGATNGVSRVASPAISVTPVGNPVGRWENGVFSVCAHTTAPVEYHWTLLPDNCLDWLVPDAYGDAHLSVVDPFLLGLFPAMNGGPSHGGLSFWNFDPTGAHSRLWGPLSAPVASHPCAAGPDALCLSCGRSHGASEPCFHSDECATKTNLAADCTCPPPFVRIGDELALRLAGEEGCCCASLIVSPDLVSSSPALGASVSNDWIVLAPTDRSPTIGGHSAQYRVFDATGGVHRALTLRATAADLGIDPLPLDAPVPYDWQEGPEAYYVTNGTLWLARRPEPYPVRVWNRSPSDARLIFAFDSTGDGPKLKTTVSGDPLSALCATNTALAAPDADLTVWLDASGTNGAATLSLTLSDPTSSRTLLSESLCVRVIDTDPGEHWRVRSAGDTLSWDFSDAPEAVYAYLWRPNADSVFGDLIDFKLGNTPSLSLDLPSGDYLLDFYFPRVYDGGSWAAWSTNYLHIVHTEVTPLENLRFTNATERACFALTNNNGQVANWTISPVVAGGPMLHASKTGGAGSATHVDNATSVWVQAGTAPGRYTITATHPNCPVSTTNATFTVGRVDIESLLFNWDTTGSARDAINLRWNYKDAINLATGEWTRAGYRAPACYVTNASPLVKATLSVAPTNLPAVRLFAETSAAVGGFAVTNVTFSNGAASNVVLSTRSATTNCVLKETFDLTWKAVVSNETEIVTNTLGRTDGHVFYTILDKPKLPWTDSEIANTNVWVSALEFVITNACEGKTTKHTALSAIPTFLFSSNSLTYDTTNGRAHFIVGSSFDLTRYISPNGGNRLVNCYDQAHGVAFLGATLGIDSTISVMDPFGYLNPVPIVGIGICNNPFFSSPDATVRNQYCDENDSDREYFIRHCFVLRGGFVFDACAGPEIGTNTLASYVSTVVDVSTTNEQEQVYYDNTTWPPTLKTLQFGNTANCGPISFTLKVK